MSSSSVENDQNNQNDQDSTKKKRGGSQKKSWHKGSTGILIDHLSGKHQITKETTKQNYVPPEFHGLKITPHKESRQIELRNLLISWIIFDTQPLNITHSKSFQRFIKELDPAFNIPNVKLIKQTIQSAYNYTLPLIQKFVENNAISINLRTDMWTDEWGLRDKTNVIVTDNGANMKKAIKEMNNITSNIKWQPCTAHTLQLVVGKGLNSVKLLVLRAKKLIDFFLRPKQSQRLEEIQKKSQNQIDVNAGKTSEYFLQMVADISTRWNSTYYAWDRLIKIKGYIQILIVELVNNESDIDAKKDGKQLEKIMLSSDEWELLQQLVITLGPFEEATNYLGGEKYITHSIMNPVIEQIKTLLLLPLSNSPSSSTPTSPTLSTLPVTAFNTLEIYQEIENAADIFVLIEEVEILENNVENNNNQAKEDKINLDKPLETKDLLDQVKKDLYNAMCFYWNVLSEDYIVSTILDPRIKSINNKVKGEEILRKKYEEYKENYLPTPNELFLYVTSTPSERLFSDAGNLLTAKRSKMNSELFKHNPKTNNFKDSHSLKKKQRVPK
ncbi:zinc finger BED domain-containing protein 4-like [Rhizophagus irregularis DAOM 181602=DAOM 197198]|nr:zinc finger BED domain-containing protein 4-like [Rhizophagus irregularis DAOM 181602=DAOM 197198]